MVEGVFHYLGVCLFVVYLVRVHEGCEEEELFQCFLGGVFVWFRV